MVTATLLADCVALARAAGLATLEHYRNDTAVEYKDDRSPLTAADRASHQLITETLAELSPEVPIISEEGELPGYSVRRSWRSFWLVDPLDGTKEFIKGNGEFTVNIALIEDGRPELGVIYAPALDLIYAAASGEGAWRSSNGAAPEQIATSGAAAHDPLTVAESRSHPSAELEEYLSRLTVADRVQVGSSLKFGLVADGTADVYPRLGPTMEWDVAAGHCLVRCASQGGANVWGLGYNSESLRNGPFVVGPPGLPDPVVGGGG